jgi:hypothetical protein
MHNNPNANNAINNNINSQNAQPFFNQFNYPNKYGYNMMNPYVMNISIQNPANVHPLSQNNPNKNIYHSNISNTKNYNSQNKMSFEKTNKMHK